MHFPKLNTILKQLFFVLAVLQVYSAKSQTTEDLVAYVGDQGNDRFYESVRLNDGTYLVCGSSQREEWMLPLSPFNLQRSPDLNNIGTTEERYGFLLHLSADAQTVLDLARFKKGEVDNIKQIRLDEQGGLYIAGDIAFDINETTEDQGYYIAKLDNNFIDGTPTAMLWGKQILARDELLEKPAWDVTSDGRVVYTEGKPYSDDDLRIYQLSTSGQDNVAVEYWRSHMGQSKTFGTPAEFIASSAFSNPSYATIESYIHVSTATCELRSWSQTEFDSTTTDQAGEPKQGLWPMDNLYSQPCDTSNPFVSAAGPGTSKATESNTKVGHVADLRINKETNQLYLALTFEVIKSSTNFRRESYLICLEDNGSLDWWTRLHSAPSTNNSTSFEINCIDVHESRNEVAIMASMSEDMTFGYWSNSSLVAGSGQESLLDDVPDSSPEAVWVAKFHALSGEALSSTYIAGLTDNGLSTSPTLNNATDWANPNSGNPSFTDCYAGKTIEIDDQGQIFTSVVTEGWPTTDNAYQQQTVLPKTSSDQTTQGSYGLVLSADLSELKYSSLFTGAWTRSSGNGGDNTTLWGFTAGPNNGFLTGWHNSASDASNAPIGNLVPFHFQEYTQGLTQAAVLPTYGTQSIGASTKDNALIAQLSFEKSLSAEFSMLPSEGICVDESVRFSDLSVATSGVATLQWSFGTGASPSTSSQSEVDVSWSSAGAKTIQLIVTDALAQKDTSTLQINVLDIGDPSFVYSGQTDSVPTTLQFNSNSSPAGQSHSWIVRDSTGRTFASSNSPSFNHLFEYASPEGSTFIIEHTLSNGTCDSSSSQSITITGDNQLPTANFTINGEFLNEGGGCVGDEFVFEHPNNPNITTWDWFFGEGSSPIASFEQGPHTVKFETSGTKTVYLEVSDGGISDRFEVTLEITGGENSKFKFFGDTTTAPTILAFQSSENNGTDYFWDFGNPFDTALSQGTGKLINMQFEIPGFYAVTHEVNTGFNCKLIQQRIIEVGDISDGPSADFYFSPSNGACINNQVVVHEVSDGGHLINSSNFVWNFGEDAVPQTYTGYTPPPVSWTKAGKKVITLMVNNKVLRSKFYWVYGTPSGAFAIDNSQSDCATGLPHKVWLSPAGTNSGSSYAWDMDASDNPGTLTSVSSFPSTSFTEDRDYTIQFTETNSGCSSASVGKLDISTSGCEVADNAAGIAISGPGEGCNESVHTVVSTSTGTILNYTWSGINAVGPGPHTVFGLTSGAQITLDILDNLGGSDSITITVP